jgi:hypothetical protein
MPNTVCVMLTMNRLDKFKRLYPTARHIKTGQVEAANKVLSDLTEDDMKVLTLAKLALPQRLNLGTHMEIDDPEINKIFDAKTLSAGYKSDTMDAYLRAKHDGLLLYVNDRPTDERYRAQEKFDQYITKNYPLLAPYHKPTADHVTEYVNAIFAGRK